MTPGDHAASGAQFLDKAGFAKPPRSGIDGELTERAPDALFCSERQGGRRVRS